MEYVLGLIVFLFGSAVGSFILVIAERYNTGLSFFKGRSVCFSCGEKLTKKDLFPVFSFLFLKGRCRYCGSKIPASAFWTEITMGLLSLLAAFKSGFLVFPIIHNSYFLIQTDFSWLITIKYLLLVTIFATLLLITIYDIKHFIIPDSFLITLFILAFLHNSYFMIVNSSFSFLPHVFSLASGLIVTLPFLALFMVSRGRWLGFGDVKYILVLGFMLGLSSGLSAVILAFWIGAVFSVFIISLKKILPKISLPIVKNNLTIKSEIPFGPFLSLGAVINICFSLDIFKLNDIINFL